jgi:hypothetical protein
MTVGSGDGPLVARLSCRPTELPGTRVALTVAIQMDPIEGINIDTDSTFMLALEARARGCACFVYGPKEMSLHGNRVTAPTS